MAPPDVFVPHATRETAGGTIHPLHLWQKMCTVLSVIFRTAEEGRPMNQTDGTERPGMIRQNTASALVRACALPLLAGVLCGFSPAVFAADKAINCERTINPAELLTCAQKDLNSNQKKLDALMKRGEKQIPASALPLFRAAQTTWMAYRDAECAWNALDLDNGSTIELSRLTCMSDLTASRIDELEASIGGP